MNKTNIGNSIYKLVFLRIFRIKNLSVYQLTLILLILTSVISVGVISAGWAIDETLSFKKEISTLKETAIEKQREELKQEVSRLITYLEYKHKDTVQYSLAQIKVEVLEYFESLRFGNDGYVFVNTYEGFALLFEGKKLDEPKSMSRLDYPSGINFYETELNLAKLPDGGSFQYPFEKINDSIPYPKISYIMGFDEWGWIIGAGDYLDNLDNEILLLEKGLKSNLHNSILKVIGIFILVLIILLFLSAEVAKFIQNQFNKFVSIINQTSSNKENKSQFDQIYIRDLKLIGLDIIHSEELVKQFGNIIDQSNNEIYIFRQDDLQFVHANKGAIQNCGYSLSEFQKITPLDTILELNKEQFLSLVEPLKQKQIEQIRFEAIQQRKNKTKYPVDVHISSSLFNEEPVFVAIVYDISEQNKVKKALFETNEIIKRSPVVAFRWEREEGWPVEFVSENVEQLTGYTIKEFIRGKISYSNIIHKEDVNRVSEEVARYSAEEKTISFTHEPYRIITKKGEIKWVNDDTFIRRTPEGIITHFEGIVSDITDIKRAEEKLFESESRYRMLFNSNPSPMWVYDLKTLAFLEVNNAAVLSYGYSKKEFLLMTLKDIRPKQDVSKLLTHVSQKRPEYQNSGEWKHQSKDGTIFDVEIISHQLLFNNKEAVLVLANNITERKAAEQELIKYREHLEEVVKERTAELEVSQDALLNLVDDLNIKSSELEKSNSALAEINKELETFTYSVSHDLKAPLRGIDGYSQLLIDTYYNELNEEAKSFLKNIRHSTMQMNTLIEDLLAYSRMERKDFHLEKIMLTPFVDNVLLQFSMLITKNNITIQKSLPKNFSLVVDKDGLNLVMRNLLDNAIKFSAQNKKAHIEIGASESDSKWFIFVKDNGIGFDMKYHNRIFNIFQRLHLPEEYEGTGIGLAMVSKAILRMNGKVWAESEPGTGTCFYLEIRK